MQADKRGQAVATFGLVLQLALAGLATGLWHFTRLPAVLPALWLMLAPVPVWLMTLLLFYCRFLRQREEEEIQQLASRADGREGLFVDGRQVRPAAQRLGRLERIVVPVFTLLLAGYHVAIGALTARYLAGGGVAARGENASGAFFFALGGAFVAFLFSRYATGMAKVDAWRLLRAPGSYLFTNAVVFVLLAIAFVGEYWNAPLVGKAVAYFLPAFMMVVGVELVLNLVLDIYRPRLPGAEHRLSYDSRLANLIASPESIGHGIAEALNYQFGFEVSSTWFYQLLQRVFVPLVLTGVLVLWLLTSVVIVDEGQQYVVLHWGRADTGRLLSPRSAPYLIWPWPIDAARKFETGKVHEILLGVGGQRQEELVNNRRIYLWTEEHGPRSELDLLVAIASFSEKGQARPQDVPPVNIIKLVVGVYYRITDAYKFGYTATDPQRLLEDIAQRELVQYGASATLDEPLAASSTGVSPVGLEDTGQRPVLPATSPARPQGIMSSGRQQTEADLKARIAAAAADYDLGVEILSVQVLACHPPKEAAPAFEAVIAAERDQDRARYAAQAFANKALAEVAGYADDALLLAQAITIQQELETLASIRREGGDFVHRLGQATDHANLEVQKLSRELNSLLLLGQVKGEGAAATEKLLADQRTYLDLLKRLGDDPALDLQTPLKEARDKTDRLFAAIQGQAAVTVDQARAYRWTKEFQERARAETFGVELLALRAAPDLYRMDKYLQVLTESLSKKRKYVFGLDRDRIEVWLNLEQPAQTLGDITFGAKP